MTSYSVEIRRGDETLSRVIRQRFDAFQFQAHAAVYDVAGRQGLRDTRAAWTALRSALEFTRSGLAATDIKLGDYWIALRGKTA